ncbi:MAG: dTDP-4-dehydrorhamnose reductase [Kribbellaceae bacterium]|jgi:dTDP-4-dehydrorhamnose reductase|nr:dTDP-4-dehydrorhamnose reductase [Kribbellaceae bacterium]
MKLLITGGAGHLGSELIRLTDHEVVATYNNSAPASGVHAYRVDIRRRAEVEALIREVRPDAIINTAYRQSDWATTADGAANVAAAARGARLIQVSSDAVFSGKSSPYDELSPPDPVTPYGAAKAAAETAVRVIDPTAVIARTSLVIGGSSPHEQLVHRLAAGEPGSLFTDNIRCPVHVSDLASALLELLESDHAGVAHLAGPEPISRYDMGRLIAERDGIDTAVLPRGSGPSDIRMDSTHTQFGLKTTLRGVSEFLRG